MVKRPLLTVRGVKQQHRRVTVNGGTEDHIEGGILLLIPDFRIAEITLDAGRQFR
ncbi:hypothetical protein D3C75_785210 [compost metagenome]